MGAMLFFDPHRERAKLRVTYVAYTLLLSGRVSKKAIIWQGPSYVDRANFHDQLFFALRAFENR